MELGTLCTTVASPEASGIYTELWGVLVIPYGYSNCQDGFWMVVSAHVQRDLPTALGKETQ